MVWECCIIQWYNTTGIIPQLYSHTHRHHSQLQVQGGCKMTASEIWRRYNCSCRIHASRAERGVQISEREGERERRKWFGCSYHWEIVAATWSWRFINVCNRNLSRAMKENWMTAGKLHAWCRIILNQSLARCQLICGWSDGWIFSSVTQIFSIYWASCREIDVQDARYCSPGGGSRAYNDDERAACSVAEVIGS